MKITSFDKDNLKTVRQTINSALERAEEELGISLSIGNISYDRNGNGFTTKLEGAVVNESGQAMDKQVRDFIQYARFQPDLEPEDLFKEFEHDGTIYKIVGWRPRSKKYPVICESEGISYKFPADLVALRLKTAEVA